MGPIEVPASGLEMKTVTPRTVLGWGERRTKQVGWYDPMPTARLGLNLSGREFLQGIIDGQIPPPPIAELLGMELVSVAEGEAVFRSTPDESVYNPLGSVHGGFMCTLLDSAAACALHTLLPAGVGYTTIEIKVSFLKTVRGDAPVEVKGRVLRVGRRVAFAEAHASAGNGELVAHATTSLALIGRME